MFFVLMYLLKYAVKPFLLGYSCVLYYIVLSLHGVCMCFAMVIFVFLFGSRDPLILAHAIGALLYLCIHCNHALVSST